MWRPLAAVTQTVCAATGAAVLYSQLQPAPLVYVKTVSGDRVELKLANVGLIIESMALTTAGSQTPCYEWAAAVAAGPDSTYRVSGSDALLGPQLSRPFRGSLVAAVVSPRSSAAGDRLSMDDIKHHLAQRELAVHVRYRLAHDGPLSWWTISRTLPLRLKPKSKISEQG
jgi:hypothetical protein